MFSSFSFSPQFSSSQPPPLLWPPLIFLLSEPHTQLNVPLLLFLIEPGAVALPYAFAVFLAIAL